MNHKLLLQLSIAALLSNGLTAQSTTEKDLELLNGPEEAKRYLESHESKTNKFIVFNEEKHKTIFAKELFKLSVGGTKVHENELEKTYYKIIEKNSIPHYRVSYIFLDAGKMSLKEIQLLRDRIIEKFNNGAPFDFLAKQYSMDANATRGGDSGWFTTGDHLYDFEDNIINDTQDLNTIFTLDFPKASKYYVILKTHEPKNISEIKVLKVQETKS